MRRPVFRMAAIIVWWVGSASAAVAQTPLTVGTDLIFYGDNTEFRNPFREGETILGAAVRLAATADITHRATITLGVFGNYRFGAADDFEQVRPVIALRIRGKRSTFVFGTLWTPRAGQPAGPDRTGPHGLLPPLQRETLAFDRPYEAGLQWVFGARRWNHDAWINWQRLNTPSHRERFDAGSVAAFRLTRALSIPLHLHIVHEGGQLFAAGPVRDSMAIASGVAVHGSPGLLHTASLELFGLASRHVADREEDTHIDGGAFLGRASLEHARWRAHLLMWRGKHYIKDEGDPNYLSLRRDGRRYGGIRDYAEAGLTRSFNVGPDLLLEASARFHRIERHYEYSYRILAVAGLSWKIR